MENNILLATTEAIEGREIVEVLGLVTGNTIQTRHIGSDIGAGLKSIIGGEIKGYVKAMTMARQEATKRMMDDARTLGADAVVGMRYSTSQVIANGAEILAYGTAVKLR